MNTRCLLAAVIAAAALSDFAVGSGAATTRRTVGLPNPSLTPGATNPRVTQATIHSTICVAGYTATIRPPESYTESLKYRQLDSGYNLKGDTSASNYEEDHLIPLEVGGNPTSVKNLWPEPRYVTWSASKKDQLENTMHRLVCDGRITLALAQHELASNWIAGYQRYVAG